MKLNINREPFSAVTVAQSIDDKFPLRFRLFFRSVQRPHSAFECVESERDGADGRQMNFNFNYNNEQLIQL